jgi:hypothetical protein
MWQIQNRTPFAAERAWTRGRDGAEIWLVAVKCTFDITADGRTRVAADQPPVLLAPEYVDGEKPAASSLKYDVDLVRTKATTDVIVLGHAYAPEGREVAELDVGFRVGPVTKRLRVTGDRVWRRGAASEPQPFVRMPIVYERAYGGTDPATSDTAAPQWDTRNPLGTGFVTTASAAEGLRLPNIYNPDQPLRGWSERPAPAGFGPVCSHWQPRVALAGTYDDRWQQDRFPLVPLDFDDRFFQCAPPDQQTPRFLAGRESVVLANLTPAGELRFDLPRVFLGFETFFYTGGRHIHEKPRLHTVIIEADVPRVSLVWHTALPCHPKVYKLDRTRITRKRLLGGADDDEELDEEDDA